MLLFSPAHASWLMRSTTAAATKTAILVLTFRDSIALLLFSIHARRSNASAGLALFDPRPLIDDIWNFTLDLVAGGIICQRLALQRYFIQAQGPASRALRTRTCLWFLSLILFASWLTVTTPQF